jgi:hypothetical protein
MSWIGALVYLGWRRRHGAASDRRLKTLRTELFSVIIRFFRRIKVRDKEDCFSRFIRSFRNGPLLLRWRRLWVLVESVSGSC